MPYRKISALPHSVSILPEHAKYIYMKTFNNAWEQYADSGKRKPGASREVTARKVAWNAAKHVYHKMGKMEE